MHRRQFITNTLSTLAASTLASHAKESTKEKQPLYDISLAQWSLRHMLQDGKLTNLDFPKFTKDQFGIHAVEYVSRFFEDNISNKIYLKELKDRCDGEGVRNLLIMCDRIGQLASDTEAKRSHGADRFKPWLEAAQYLGCHSIRVNLNGKGTDEEVAKLAIDGMQKLCTIAKPLGINILVENHGGKSSNPKWLAHVLGQVGQENCGALPDFGNFKEHDRYDGVKQLMPYAKGISAKSRDFNELGQETETDYLRIMKIVKKAGYRGHVGIEYVGQKISEVKGIQATQKLLKLTRRQLS